MRGKIGIVVGLAAGYVLGTRAGRERYEQIKSGFLKVWNTAPVQKQVGRVAEAGKTAALALPSALWDGAVKVTKAATKNGTPGQKLDAAIKAAEPNDFSQLVAVAPRLRRVCFNGQTAGRLASWFVGLGYETRILPSTSPAYTLVFSSKVARWREAWGLLH